MTHTQIDYIGSIPNVNGSTNSIFHPAPRSVAMIIGIQVQSHCHLLLAQLGGILPSKRESSQVKKCPSVESERVLDLWKLDEIESSITLEIGRLPSSKSSIPLIKIIVLCPLIE